jgi:hypothetical protein
VKPFQFLEFEKGTPQGFFARTMLSSQWSASEGWLRFPVTPRPLDGRSVDLGYQRSVKPAFLSRGFFSCPKSA